MVAAQEQGMGSSKDQHHNRHRYPLVEAHLSIKGKRTKRPRPASPARITTALTMSSVSPSASACYNSGTDDEATAAGATRPVTTTTAASSTTTASADQYPSQISGGSSTATDKEEEEDMANCLILLAQGDRNKENNNNTSTQRSNDSRHQRQPTAEVPVTFPKETSTAVMESGSIRTKTSSSSVPPSAAAASSSAYAAYECKTCNRCFPSFQALGGHRASHKRPKQTAPDPLERKQLNISSPFSDHDGVLNDDGSSLSLQIGITASCNNRYHDGIITTTTTPPYNKSKVHECSICGAVFSSGQALGGHMRRHRTLLSGGGVGGGASAVAANPVSSAAPTMIGGRRIDENIKEAVEDHEDVKRTRTLLSLDLNLPAPEDDHRGDHHHHHHQEQQQPSKFVFSSNDRTLLLSASSLVDCHY